MFLLAGYDLGTIRDASFGQAEIYGYVRNSGMISSLINLLIPIIDLIAIASSITYATYDIKKRYPIILLALILEIFRSFTYGGRYGLAYMIVELIVCYSIFHKRFSNISQKTKKKLLCVISILILFIVLITLLRGTDNTELLKKYYRYICGNIVFFDLHLKELYQNDNITLSFAGFYGIWNIFLPFIHLFGIPFPEVYEYTLNNILDTQIFRQIGEGMYTNAFITPFYHPFADFGLIGVILYMGLFGFFAGYYFKKAIIGKKENSIIIYLIISQMIFKSLQGYPMVFSVYPFGLLIMYIHNKYRIKIR